jgi:16S rRNA (guanine527-N7)-methyltransferase
VEQLIHFCSKQLRINLNKKQLNSFNIFQDELLKWNQKFNLTSITDSTEIEVKHFIDSLTCLLAMDATQPLRIIDVGTGAGFPGVPIKIVHPDIDLTLLESTQKKVDFCKYLLKRLNLDHAVIISGRAEEIAHYQEFREGFDFAIARAVAGLPVLMEFLMPFIKIGGDAIALKGKDIQKELDSSKKAVEVLGGEIKDVKKISLPGIGEERNLIVIKKVYHTPLKYPRRPGIPAKKPLI